MSFGRHHRYSQNQFPDRDMSSGELIVLLTIMVTLFLILFFTLNDLFTEHEQTISPLSTVSYCVDCRSIQMVLPPSSTPGFIDVSVTQSNIHSTVCVPGYTQRIRPSSSFTRRLKIHQLQTMFGLNVNPSAYIEDHRVPLELGGHPTNPRNLWPEPRIESRIKDGLEDRLHRALCGDLLTLKAAQMVFLGDYRKATNWNSR